MTNITKAAGLWHRLLPVWIAKMFFRRFDLVFGVAQRSFVNFRFDKDGKSPLRNQCFSASGSTATLRHMLAAGCMNIPGVSDKSIKMAGVTTAFDSRALTEQVMHLCRWKTLSVPLHYKHNTPLFEKNVAQTVPPIGWLISQS